MLNLVKKFEHTIVVMLMAMLVIVVALSTVELGWILYKDLASAPVLMLEIGELLEIFGFFLLVLIGIELLETIKKYIEHGYLDLKVIFEVALIALGRKISTFDATDYDGIELIGLAAIILALVVGYALVTDRLGWRIGSPRTGANKTDQLNHPSVNAATTK